MQSVPDLYMRYDKFYEKNTFFDNNTINNKLKQREAMGVVTSEQHSIFSSSQCLSFRQALIPDNNNSVIEEVTRDNVIFIVVDPTGGGDSKLALMSVACKDGMLILVSVHVNLPMLHWLSTCTQNHKHLWVHGFPLEEKVRKR